MIGPAWKIVLALVTAAAGLVLIAAAIEGHLDRPLALWFRLGLGAAGLGLVFPSVRSALVSAAVIAVLFGTRVMMRARRQSG